MALCVFINEGSNLLQQLDFNFLLIGLVKGEQELLFSLPALSL